MEKTVVILGTPYKVKKKRYEEEPYFKKNSCDGYCDSIEKEIMYCNMSTYPGWEEESEEKCRIVEMHTLRHELIHAFLNESGLQENSAVLGFGWASNEEMVDWIAIQFLKILEACRQVGAV